MSRAHEKGSFWGKLSSDIGVDTLRQRIYCCLREEDVIGLIVIGDRLRAVVLPNFVSAAMTYSSERSPESSAEMLNFKRYSNILHNHPLARAP